MFKRGRVAIDDMRFLFTSRCLERLCAVDLMGGGSEF